MQVIFYAIGIVSLAVGGFLALQGIGLIYPIGGEAPYRWWLAGGLALSGLLWVAIGRALSLLQTIAEKR